jgi:hypothetical protein
MFEYDGSLLLTLVCYKISDFPPIELTIHFGMIIIQLT